MNGIQFLLDERAHRMGEQKWVEVDYDKSPHCLWSGRTGSGKTVAAKLLIARTILLAPPELQPVEVTVLDPKNDEDFSFLDGLPRVYRGEDAVQGWADIFESFKQRQCGYDNTRNLKLCFCDEFASLVSLIEDKKEREAAQRYLTLLLMLSRSFRFSIQLATQQPSAKIFGSGASGSREQFGVIAQLADGGSETREMLFDRDSRKKMEEYGTIGERGAGWVSINGGIAQPVIVPYVADMNKLNAVIYDSMANPQTLN